MLFFFNERKILLIIGLKSFKRNPNLCVIVNVFVLFCDLGTELVVHLDDK